MLNVARDATEREIKKAYHKLALKLHPDKLKGRKDIDFKKATQQFIEIALAYEVLSDEDRRKRYDLLGDESEVTFS